MSLLAIEVAGLAPFPLVFEYQDSTLDFDRPWEGLPRATVVIEPTATLRQVLGQACVKLDVSLAPEMVEGRRAWQQAEGLSDETPAVAEELVYLLFRQRDDDLPLEGEWDRPYLRRESRQKATTVVVRDSKGRAIWRRPGLDATMKELIDAAACGLVEGDPLNPYLVPSIPQGDLGGFDQWLHFKEALVALAAVAGMAATADGALGFLDRVRALYRRRGTEATAVVDTHAAAWSERGAAPSDLLQMLSQKPRRTAEVAALLGCSEAEAAALLWGLGFTASDEGLWVHRGDAVASFIADDIELAFLFEAQLLEDPEVLRDSAKARLAAFQSTGLPPDLADTRDAVLEVAFSRARCSKRPSLLRALLARLRREG